MRLRYPEAAVRESPLWPSADWAVARLQSAGAACILIQPRSAAFEGSFRMNSILVAGAAAVYLLSAHQPAVASDLNGAQVTTGVYCCTSPIPSNLRSNLAVSTVGPSVELPTGSLFGSTVIPISIDFSANSISTVFTSSASAASGSFNGYLFQFDLAPGLFISSVTLNRLSNYTPVSVSFTSTTVAINNASLNFVAGSRAVVDVTVSAVPEPESVALLGAGLLLVTYKGRKRSERFAVA